MKSNRLITKFIVPAIVLLTVGFSKVADAQTTGKASQNKRIIKQAFDQWASGSGNFFDLLTDDVQWTITGSSRFSKTYTSKKQFIDQTVTPLTVRLAKPIKPTLQSLYADGDVVVAIWDGATTAKDGKPYRNTYSWAMTLKNGRINRVTAFLDLIMYEDVFKRIPAVIK
ncbi:nuclear transport factor 2 family protein [Spirosoma arcticum]